MILSSCEWIVSFYKHLVTLINFQQKQEAAVKNNLALSLGQTRPHLLAK